MLSSYEHVKSNKYMLPKCSGETGIRYSCSKRRNRKKKQVNGFKVSLKPSGPSNIKHQGLGTILLGFVSHILDPLGLQLCPQTSRPHPHGSARCKPMLQLSQIKVETGIPHSSCAALGWKATLGVAPNGGLLL